MPTLGAPAALGRTSGATHRVNSTDTHALSIVVQHAVTFAAGLACEGMIPFCAIYSSFLQRGYDQIVHDVALQSLPVRFAMDRAGLVGADGATHCGFADVTYMSCVPNMVVMAVRPLPIVPGLAVVSAVAACVAVLQLAQSSELTFASWVDVLGESWDECQDAVPAAAPCGLCRRWHALLRQALPAAFQRGGAVQCGGHCRGHQRPAVMLQIPARQWPGSRPGRVRRRAQPQGHPLATGKGRRAPAGQGCGPGGLRHQRQRLPGCR